MEIKESHSKTRGFFLVPSRTLHTSQSEFQKIQVFEHDFYGKVLRLDNYFQLSEYDEFIYHEALTHYPLFSHLSPSKILLIGGGDGCALREILKHDVESITHVELDSQVIEVSKKYFSEINRNSFDNIKVKTLIQDGLTFLETTDEKFDIIILDLTDPTGESKKLYTQEFYTLISSKLNPQGVLSLHIEQPLAYPKTFSRIYNTLASCFSNLKIHTHFIPIYGTELSFAICSNSKLNYIEKNIPNLKLLSKEYFQASLVMPNYISSLKNIDKRIITSKEPLGELE